MTNQSRALGALIGCGLSVIYLVLLPGCSLEPDDAIAATNSADSPKQVEAATEPAPSIDAPKNITERLDNSTSTENVALRNTSDEDGKLSGGAIKQTASSSRTAAETSESAAGKPDTTKTFELTFDDLTFEMEKTEKFKRSMLTERINSYDGGRVRLRGFIRPSFSQSGLTKFVFVRDNKECCFGPGAALYDCVLVRLAKGKKTEYTVRPVTIEGEFYLKEYEGPDGKVWSIYRMKDAFVR